MRPVTLSREVKLDSTPFHIFCKQQRWRLGFFVLGLFRETIKKVKVHRCSLPASPGSEICRASLSTVQNQLWLTNWP